MKEENLPIIDYSKRDQEESDRILLRVGYALLSGFSLAFVLFFLLII